MIKSQHVVHMIIDDLEAAESKMELLSMELLSHKDDIASAFSGTMTSYGQIVSDFVTQLRLIASDLEKGHAGAPQVNVSA